MTLTTRPKADQPGVQELIWEHGRRNFLLGEEGKLAIVCPVTVEAELNGIGIFTTSLEETKKIMDGDPAVMAGVFEYELHPCIGFPGDGLR